jgi:two-component system CheB/CheR fusion protein
LSIEEPTGKEPSESLIQESERFRLLADNAPLLIWVNGLEGREYVNRHYLEYVGATEADAVGPDWARFVHPDDRARYQATYSEAMASRCTFQGEFRFRRADGNYCWMRSIGTPRLTDAGEMLGFVGFMHHIDDLVRAREARLVSEQSLAAELAAMTRLQAISGRLVQARDFDVFLQEIVDAAIFITGADMGNILLLERGSNLLRLVAHKGFEQPFLEFFSLVGDGGAAMKRGERVVVEDVSRSEIFRDSPALDVLVSAGVRAVQSTPLISRSGTLVGILSTHYRTVRRPADRDLGLLDLIARQVADGIERTQIEEARLEAVARSQQLVEVIPAGVYSVNGTGAITFYNHHAVELWGRRPEPGAGGERLWQRVPPIGPPADSWHADVGPVGEALRTGASVRNQEEVIARPDGSRLTVHVNVDPIRDGSGRIVGATVVFHDVTALKQAEAVLTDADQRKDEFIAMLAHELRNPLAAVHLTVELMRRGAAGDKVKDDLRLMDRQVAHLSRLVNDMLDVSRIQQGKIPLQKAQIDLRNVVQSAVESVGPAVKGKRELAVELPSEAILVEGDAERLEQVVRNLLDNAIKYTDAAGQIGVALEAPDGQAVLRVRDTGIGVKPELLPHVFELFAQGDDSLARSSGGLGIGLYMVAKLTQMHGGSVEVRSEGAGKGTEFTIRLPRMRDAGLPAPAEAEPGTASAGAPQRILVVEDNVDLADQLAVLLRLDGHEVRLEREGTAAVSAANEFRPQAVLLDIGLPGMDGYEVARNIRRQLDGVVIIGLSGYTHEEARRRAREAGFDEHLAKPVDPDVLLATLSRLVRPAAAREPAAPRRPKT